MDEKTPLIAQDELEQQSHEQRQTYCARQTSRLRQPSFGIFLALIVFLWIVKIPLLLWIGTRPNEGCASGSVCIEEHQAVATAAKVPLEAHIMSKCPDAKDCLHDLILPTMANLSDKVDFTLSYIGRPTNHDDGVACMHGQTECLGNMIELCAASVYSDPKQYLGFTMCMFNDYKNIPDKHLVMDCAAEFGMDFEKLNECVSRDDGEFGMDLLRDSVERSSEANVTKSCTVRLNGEVRCIRDGGEWYDCEGGSKPKDLIADIQKLAEEKVRESISQRMPDSALSPVQAT